jgi:flagellar basal-body rod modification protein FlgD
MTTTSPVTNATSAPPSTSGTGSTAQSLADLSKNFDTFLSLLTTQLKNQDPLSPLDSNQFTQQLVQMSGVEQQIQANSLLQTIAANTSSGVATAISLIGKTVKAVSSTATLSGGAANWTYNLPDGVSDLKLTVSNSAGEIVDAVAPGDLSAGDHAFTWNGKDLNGAPLPDGDYTLQVSAKDTSGADLTANVFVQGPVTSVEQSNGKTLITVDGTPVDWSTVSSVSQTPASGGP